MNEPLPPALSGERLRLAGPAGELTVYKEGGGAPLLLIHSINAAASAAEMRPLHQHFRALRTVYSIDLPGYGLSERADVDYSPRIMTDAVLASGERIRRDFPDDRVDAVAVSLSCEYLARAAVEAPELFGRIALVSPTGFNKNIVRRAPTGTTRGVPWLLRALRGPGWGRWLFEQLTRPAVLRYFLGRTWGSKAIDEELWRYDMLTSRQINAEFAPLRFLSGFLFSADIHTVYDALSQPIWMSHGIRGDFTDYGGKTRLSERANWRFTTFPTGALPYFEVTEEFCTELERFLG